ncbi:MAG: threonylcarbamoyl-AMP synthase [Proteobacteria bacterium]|nr:threonylcarbamoyl-AMP synthase [Pseudomonadota bacterium]
MNSAGHGEAAPETDAANILAPTPGNVAEAARILRRGGLVAFATETVYGLGADATNGDAVAAIFETKGRPRFNPLIVHVPDMTAAQRLARFDDRALALAEPFWPGPLTLVLPRTEDCMASQLVSAGLDTIAVRAPKHSLAQDLLRAAGTPLAAPSANASGRASPTTAQHVAESLGGRVDMILDGGPCPIGIESTVVGLFADEALLLRPGGVTRAELEAVVGPLGAAPETERPRSPGLLQRHYAPGRPLRLGAAGAAPGEALLAFGPGAPQGAAVRNLSPTGDLREAAANFFAMLHELDRPEFSAIAVMPIPGEGLGAAINDRLRRAAAKEP